MRRLILTATLALMASTAAAHLEYPQKCCNHVDCGQVHPDDISKIRFDGNDWIVPAGVRVIMHNSANQMTGIKVLSVPFRVNENDLMPSGQPRIFDSLDGGIHLCVDGLGEGLCLGIGVQI